MVLLARRGAMPRPVAVAPRRCCWCDTPPRWACWPGAGRPSGACMALRPAR